MALGPYRLQFLHISDLHAKGPKEREPWRRRRVLGDAWLRNLETLLQEEGAIQFVFFTGDAAQSGKPEEYAEVTDFFGLLCEELGIGLDRLFVIPGNLDIDRDVQRSAWESMRMRLAASNDLLGISRWMNGISARPPLGFEAGWKTAILERQHGYRTWVTDHLRRAELAAEELGYRSTVRLPGWALPIHILGLDTSWLCGDDADTGRLLLTENQVGRHLTDDRGNPLPGLRIALMHHPLHELVDATSAKRLLADHADLVLRGHLHQTEVVEWIDPDRRLRELASGSLYEGGLADTYRNSCQFVRLELDSNLRPIEAMVRLRSFSPRGGHWFDDNGLSAGVAFGVAYFGAFFRLPIWLLEVLVQITARYRSLAAGQKSLHWAPVLYHNLSYLPHPFLERLILTEAAGDPVLTRRVLDACSLSPGQRRTGRRVEAALRARDLKRLASATDFVAIQELRGEWLPGLEGADGVLLGFSEAGRYLAAAAATFNPHHRLRHLRGFAQQANAIENQLRSSRNTAAAEFEQALQALRAAGQQMRAGAEKAAEGLILNPFRAGDPLSDAEGPELFRGRETAIRDIEETLADATHSASLQLLAPRRAGKTSLLKMLPRLLPDTICVFFDLQKHPVASPGAFWSKLAEQTVIQAKRDRRADLPRLPDGPPMEAAARWLDQLDQLPDGRRVLIAIDEFERLEDLFPGSRQQFLQLMGLFRATIQHRRGVRLLVSGSAPFDQLDGVWDDHFISARQIKLPFLNRTDSVGLLTQPSPDFPPETIPAEVALEVFQKTGGQPFLLQVYGSLLVSRLNQEKRKVAAIDDVNAVEVGVIEFAEPYFREAYRTAPESAREVLGRLSDGRSAEMTPAVRRWLAQRYLLTPDDRLAIPVFGAWIEHHALI